MSQPGPQEPGSPRGILGGCRIVRGKTDSFYVNSWAAVTASPMGGVARHTAFYQFWKLKSEVRTSFQSWQETLLAPPRASVFPEPALHPMYCHTRGCSSVCKFRGTHPVQPTAPLCLKAGGEGGSRLQPLLTNGTCPPIHASEMSRPELIAGVWWDGQRVEGTE